MKTGHAVPLTFLISICLTGCGCSETGLGGDAFTDADAAIDDVLGDSSTDMPSDWRPEPGTGALVPEGDATFHESDVGEELWTFGMSFFPIAYSGSVYTLLFVEDASTPGTDEVAAYRFVPASGPLETIWYGEVLAVLEPSICWTGEVFTAIFPIRDVGNQVHTITEAGEHSGIETVGMVDDPGMWAHQNAKHIMCPATGPVIVDFMQPGIEGSMDTLHLLNVDGSYTGTALDVDLPPPTAVWGREACFAAGSTGACFMGNPPVDKMAVFFVDRAGSIWESGNFPDTAHFEMGGAIADVGSGAAVFWADSADWGDHINMGFSLLAYDGSFIVTPMVMDLSIERDEEMGLFAASSGSDVLVAGPEPNERGVDSGTYLYLFDLAGNLLDAPLRLEPALERECSVRLFWEGDAYAVLWNEGGGLYYRRYLVE